MILITLVWPWVRGVSSAKVRMAIVILIDGVFALVDAV